MRNLLKIKNYSATGADFYLPIDDIMQTAIDPGAGFDSVVIATNKGFGVNGYRVYLRDKDGNQTTTLAHCESVMDQLKKVLFAQPGVGVIELQGEFNLLDVAEYTQIA